MFVSIATRVVHHCGQKENATRSGSPISRTSYFIKLNKPLDTLLFPPICGNYTSTEMLQNQISSAPGASGCKGGSALNVPPHSGSRFGSLLAGARRRLGRVFLESPVLFEIRNIRTGEAAVQHGPFTDGTLADRAARELGQAWRVFRQETGTDKNLRSSYEVVSDTRRVESDLPTDAYTRSDGQAQGSFPFSRQESSTTETLEALRDALQRSQPNVAVLPTDTHDHFGHSGSLFNSSGLSKNIQFQRGQVTVAFANAVELQERLNLLSLALANEPDAVGHYSTTVPPEPWTAPPISGGASPIVRQ